MVTSFKRSHACTGGTILGAPSPASRHHQPTPPLETLATPRQVWVSLLWGHCSFLQRLGAHQVLCALHEYFPVLCKFWQLYGGVNGNLLQESLCHIQVCCTQSSRHCGSPLLTRISRGDAQTQFCLSLCGVSGSSGTQDSFEPSEQLCGNDGCPSFHFPGASPLPLDVGYLPTAAPALCSHRSSAYHLTGFSLALDLGYLLMTTPAKYSHCS